MGIMGMMRHGIYGYHGRVGEGSNGMHMKRTRRKPFDGEEVIQLKCVMSLPLFAERPSYLQVCRWARLGIRDVLLETFTQGKYCFTSVEAVERFLSATQKGSRLPAIA